MALNTSLRRDILTCELTDRLRRLNDFAREAGRTIAQTALSWVLAEGATSVIVGVSRLEQLKEDIATASMPPLTFDELETIQEILG